MTVDFLALLEALGATMPPAHRWAEYDHEAALMTLVEDGSTVESLQVAGQAARAVPMLMLDIDYLVARAAQAGHVKVGDAQRDTGMSSNNLVAIAYGAPDNGARPHDRSDWLACERAVQKLPSHRRTQQIDSLLARWEVG